MVSFTEDDCLKVPILGVLDHIVKIVAGTMRLPTKDL